MKSVQTTVDRAAIGLSIICTLHCLLLPVAIAVLPALAANSLGDESFHRLLLVAVLPTSLLALTLGCRKHRNRAVLAIGLLGLAILTLTAFLGHDYLGELGEKVATITGAAIIALGHLRNQALCRSARSSCPDGRTQEVLRQL